MSIASKISFLLPSPKKRLPLIVLALAGAGAASWALSAGKPPQATANKETSLLRPVQTHVVKIEPLVQPRLLVGTLRARIEADQGFRLAGKIAERKVQAGDRVKAGTVLATLDGTDLRLNRETTEAELAAARAAARQAELERERIAELRQKGWSTDQAFDRQKAALEEATGRLKRAERQVELAANALSYAELRAENDGIVTAVFAEAGQVISAGQPILRIARDGDREAQVSIPEQDLERARNSKAQVSLWSEPGKTYSAELRELSPNADPATRTFLARYSVKGLAADAPLGMTASLTLASDASGKVARVPLSAILNQGNGDQVFVVNTADSTLALKTVKVLSFDAREAIVTEGLDEGDRVVTLGIHVVRAGQKVRVLAEAKRN
ncbi:MAG: efflux RND transporter periplasmic adaptor subunit [Proteobacteria bacterium]|nr:efflux RND transporter periplasmic adaptor subunit [Pseudomonadota bacterium]